MCYGTLLTETNSTVSNREASRLPRHCKTHLGITGLPGKRLYNENVVQTRNINQQGNMQMN